MKKIFFALLTFGVAFPAAQGAVLPKVVLVVIDGVRDLEWQGKALDDNGRPVTAEAVLPEIQGLRKKGVFFSNLHITNPAGISLPAYSDIFAGRRQEKIVNNAPAEPTSQYPTIFQTLKRALKLESDGIGLFSSWKLLCPLSATLDAGADGNFFRSCGWEKGKYFKPEVYEGSRTDSDTFMEWARESRVRRPRFSFIHFGNADEEGHLQKDVLEKTGVPYGIFHYHNALREDDYLVGRVWKQLQSDPFYRDSTTLIVTTDHGRDNVPDPKQWSDHGECLKLGDGKLCSGCQHVFAVAVGPGLKQRTVSTAYGHTDLAPTVAKIFGVTLPGATGKPMTELFH